MRIKQTARKSTGPTLDRRDPLRGRMSRLLETKRNSNTFSSPGDDESDEDINTPRSSRRGLVSGEGPSGTGRGKGNLGRGKPGLRRSDGSGPSRGPGRGSGGGRGGGGGGGGPGRPSSGSKSGSRRAGRDPDRDIKARVRARPGQAALREIRLLQKGTNNLIPKAPFHRLIREITQNYCNENDILEPYKYQTASLEALQEATESYLVRLFEDSYMLTLHAKRVTLFTKDMELCKRIRQM